MSRRVISNKRRILSIIITIFCALIAASIVSVMMHVYDPNRNSLRALASVCMDVVCMVNVLVFVLSIVFETYNNNRTTKLFLSLMLGTMFALFFDFLNWAYDGALTYDGWPFVFTTSSLVMGPVIACLFVLYLGAYLDENFELRHIRIVTKVCAGLNLLSFVVTLILAITGNAFTFVDGHYVTGPMYDYVTLVPVVTLLYLTSYSIGHVKIIGVHDVLSVVGYILFMVVGALIESSYSIGTTYVSVCIADIFIFVMLQNRIIADERKNVKMWIEKSNTDELTGFYNRHAYEDEIASMDMNKVGENFVYVSIDINSLKKANDTMGHMAGDEMIIGAAACLRQCFGSYGKLFRTGGDEFAALIYADEDQLSMIKKDIKEVTLNWSGEYVKELAVSCGYVAKKESDGLTILKMARLADKRMYEEKARYYEEKGITRREY